MAEKTDDGSAFVELLGDTLKGPNGDVSTSAALAGKVVGLYFSAHWCPPCRGFTPKLSEWYTKDLKAKGMEIVFVSSDRDEGAFSGYFGEQPWLALPFSDRDRKNSLSQKFGVRGIPSFIILDKDGTTITKDGRAAVSYDPTGENFPWHPKPVWNFQQGAGSINETTTVCLLMEKVSKENQQATLEGFTQIAKPVFDAAKAEGKDPSMAFCVATDVNDGITGQIRNLTGIGDPQEGKYQLLILDIPDQGGYYKMEGDIENPVEAARNFVEMYKANGLQRLQLSR